MSSSSTSADERRSRGRKMTPPAAARKCCYDDGRTRTSRRRRKSARKEVAERLEALKELIPTVGSEERRREEPMTACELFEETADYILLLRTQVEVLKQLVDVYETADSGKELAGADVS